MYGSMGELVKATHRCEAIAWSGSLNFHNIRLTPPNFPPPLATWRLGVHTGLSHTQVYHTHRLGTLVSSPLTTSVTSVYVLRVHVMYTVHTGASTAHTHTHTNSGRLVYSKASTKGHHCEADDSHTHWQCTLDNRFCSDQHNDPQYTTSPPVSALEALPYRLLIPHSNHYLNCN